MNLSFRLRSGWMIVSLAIGSLVAMAPAAQAGCCYKKITQNGRCLGAESGLQCMPFPSSETRFKTRQGKSIDVLKIAESKSQMRAGLGYQSFMPGYGYTMAYLDQHGSEQSCKKALASAKSATDCRKLNQSCSETDGGWMTRLTYQFNGKDVTADIRNCDDARRADRQIEADRIAIANAALAPRKPAATARGARAGATTGGAREGSASEP